MATCNCLRSDRNCFLCKNPLIEAMTNQMNAQVLYWADPYYRKPFTKLVFPVIKELQPWDPME